MSLKQKRLVIVWLMLATLCSELLARGATYCVGPSASGDGSGSDWNNQYSWTNTPARGDTWYLRSSAGTNYSEKTLQASLSGTTLITIKKATTSSHVTDTGWSSWMHDQAILYPTLEILTGYYVVDGGYRDESNPPWSWTNWTAYGIMITNRADPNGWDGQLTVSKVDFGSPGTPANSVSISNVFVKAVYSDIPETAIHRYPVSTETGDNSSIHTGLIFSHMGIYGGNQGFFLRQSDGTIVQYSAVGHVASRADGPNNHGNGVNLYFTSDNAIVRYSLFHDMYTDSVGYSSGGTSVISIQGSSGCEVYGNLFVRYYCGNGVIGFVGGDAPNTLVYNNTIIGSSGSSSGIYLGTSGTVAYNNLFMSNSVSPSFEIATHDYNVYNDTTHSEANGQVLNASIFVDYANQDFRLANNTTAGISLSAPHNVDLYGVTRTTSSRGFSEYVESNPYVGTQTNLLKQGHIFSKDDRWTNVP